MLCYWIVRRPDGSPAGLVRAQNGCVTLQLTAPVEGTFTLFSDVDSVPILPGVETRLPGAEALLGMKDGAVCCFAAANNAAPLGCYRKRISQNSTRKAEPTPTPVPEPEQSQINTIEAEEEPEPAENPEEQSQLNTIEAEEPDSISDTARETELFSLLLNRAEAFYAAYEGMEDMVQKEDTKAENGIDLFPQAFPGARWRYVNGKDVLPHYEGIWTKWDGSAMRILAVPGHAAPRPPRQLSGFSTFLRDSDGNGYWVKVVRQ